MANNDYHDPKVIRKAISTPLLTQEEELQYVKAWQNDNDEKALDAIVRSHIRLVISISRKFKSYGLHQDDLIQEGILGIMHAAKRYDIKRKVRFATYAQWWIRSFMTEHVLRNWSLIRIGTTRDQKILFFNLRKLQSQLKGQENDSLTDIEIDNVADSLNVNKNAVRTMEQRMSGKDVSLNVTVSEDGKEERSDFLVSEEPNPEEVLAEKEIRNLRLGLLNEALSQLDERELKIIQYRRLREDPYTLEHAGNLLGISKERVRQIEVKAFDKIRLYIEQNKHKAND